MKPLDPRVRRCMCSLVLLLSPVAIGCTSTFIRSQKSDGDPMEVSSPEYVRDVARPWGLNQAPVESVALVTGLNNTGDDPPQSPQRQALIREMQQHEVHNPNEVLSSPQTGLVLSRIFLPPGVQKGDRVDVEVRAPRRSKLTSLRGGWMMETRLREMAVMGQGVHSGHVRALAQGPILVDALLEGTGDDVQETRGLILGGGVATQSRPLGLQLKSEHHSVKMSKLIGAAINQRFDTFVHGIKQGAAVPKRDNFIELIVHPRYRENIIRYFRVIEQIPLHDSGPERLARLDTLEIELLDAPTAALAALKLEAIGDEAQRVLQRGLESPNPEVRFYSAEALAYMDVADAALHLTVAAQREPAFRSRALNALGAMDHVQAHDQLTELLHVPSAETRYGAFRALQLMNPRDPIIGGEMLGDSIYLHEIATTGEPMLHVARSRRAELVLFGTQQQLKPPVVLFAGKHIMLKGGAGERLRITKYTIGQDDAVRECSMRLSDVFRQLVDLGATYPDIVEMLQQAKNQGCLQARLAFDAIPTAGRTYHRSGADEQELEELPPLASTEILSE